MKIVFLETDALGDDIDFTPFENLGEVTRYHYTEPAQYIERIGDAEVLVINKIPMEESTLNCANQLKLICIAATGTNNVDFDYVNHRNITVTNVKSYSTQSVIQHTFALFFYLYEKLRYYDDFVKSGDYSKYPIFSFFGNKFNEIDGKTWGVIGLGEIGRGVATVATQFGCRVIYYSTSGKNKNPDYEQVDLDCLLRESDVISIHAPLNKKTHQLIGEKELDKMKSNAILLNLGRGPIINEVALANALKKNTIGAAGLDVLSVEPILANSPLNDIRDSTKLIITPHMAWATVEARKRVVLEVYKNMEAYKNGDKRNTIRE